MNNIFKKKLYLSNFSLTSQVIIINVITALIGLFFVGIFNFFLLKNSKVIDEVINDANFQVLDIKNYLENAAIISNPGINLKTSSRTAVEITFSSNLQLDPYRSQEYIVRKYFDKSEEIRIFNTSLDKFVDTAEVYVPEIIDVIEISNIQERDNFELLKEYKKFYLNIFYNLQFRFNLSNLKQLVEPKKNEISLIVEVIKKSKPISTFFLDKNILFFTNAEPLVKNGNIYGVVLIKSVLSHNDTLSSTVSFTMWNIYLIIVFFMFFLSIIFTRSIISPIKKLSILVTNEQNKIKTKFTVLDYPQRNDEIGGLSEDIKNMSSKLKKRIDEVENFAADVAHELKNPLTSLKSSNELISNEKISSDDKKILFNNIQKDLDRMDKLISEITNYAITQSEVERQTFEKFDLIQFIRSLDKTFYKNKKNIKIICVLEDDRLIIKVNMDKLARVFINLIQNALSFSPSNSNIIIQQFKDNQKVIIFLADQGIGLDYSLKNKIFDRFYTDRENNLNLHTGLGLPISKEIIESFGGSIILSNKKIKGYNGACFKIELPING